MNEKNYSPPLPAYDGCCRPVENVLKKILFLGND